MSTTDIASNSTSEVTSLSWLMTSDLPGNDDYGVSIGVPMFLRISFIVTGTVGSLGNLFVFSILFKHLSKSPSMTSID